MSLSGRVFAAPYDPLMAGTEKAGLADHRRQLLEHARGRVLEIGGGTCANLPYYGQSVDEVVFTEPEEPMARRLERKLAASSLRAQVVRAPAEALPFEDSSFDVVVSTLVLCTVSDQKRALTEIHRVLKPNGRLLFLEHVRSDGLIPRIPPSSMTDEFAYPTGSAIKDEKSWLVASRALELGSGPGREPRPPFVAKSGRPGWRNRAAVSPGAR